MGKYRTLDTKRLDKISSLPISDTGKFRQVAREFALAMAFWLALLLFGAAGLGLLRPRRLSFQCGAEQVVQYQAEPYFKGKGGVFTGARRQTSKFAFEGSHSLAIYPDNHFGFEFKVSNLSGTEQLELEVWRFVESGATDIGHIVAEVPGLMWKACGDVAESRDNGWQRLFCTLEVPPDSKGKELKVYCYGGEQPVYFDNMRVEVKRRFPL